MEAAGVIKSFDIIEEESISLCPGGRDVGMKAFGFKSSPERFHSGMIIDVLWVRIAVGASAHAWGEAIRIEQGTERTCSILATAVGVMDFRRATRREEWATQGAFDQCAFQSWACFPTHDAPTP